MDSHTSSVAAWLNCHNMWESVEILKLMLSVLIDACFGERGVRPVDIRAFSRVLLRRLRALPGQSVRAKRKCDAATAESTLGIRIGRYPTDVTPNRHDGLPAAGVRVGLFLCKCTSARSRL
jgi:hypothetical protein